MRFSGQQGQTYHIAVDGYGGATGDIALNWRAAFVGSGPTKPLREQVFDNPTPGQPSCVIAGDNASLQYWIDPSGTVQQSLYESVDGTQRVRTFYGEGTELPRVVLDEALGNWLSIREHGDSRVDFWAYGSDGNYQGGFAIYEEDGWYYMGEVVGVPAHEGREISGELNPSTGSWSGSFTLNGNPADGLTNIQLLSAEQVMFLESLEPSKASETNANSPVVASIDTLREGLFWVGAAVVVIAAIPSAPVWMPSVAAGLLTGALFLPDARTLPEGQLKKLDVNPLTRACALW